MAAFDSKHFHAAALGFSRSLQGFECSFRQWKLEPCDYCFTREPGHRTGDSKFTSGGSGHSGQSSVYGGRSHFCRTAALSDDGDDDSKRDGPGAEPECREAA